MKQRRNTKQRQLILNAVRARIDHPSADEIYLDVRAIDSKISRGTVYRNLDVLAQQGEVLHVKLPHMDRFEGQADRHYHFQCIDCGAVCDVLLPYQEELDIQAAGNAEYTIERHRTVFEGFCPGCRKKKTLPR